MEQEVDYIQNRDVVLLISRKMEEESAKVRYGPGAQPKGIYRSGNKLARVSRQPRYVTSEQVHELKMLSRKATEKLGKH